jgi:Pyridoxamine 5'-phosphate oxidase
MATWADLEAGAPELADMGRRLLHARGDGEALLATVRGDEPPRVHPVNVGIVDGRLYVFVGRSAKRTDLEADGRYALHAHFDPVAPSEFSLRGRAVLVADPATRETVAGVWAFEPDDGYTLFELGIDSALTGVRSADEWPPRYTSWRASGIG